MEFTFAGFRISDSWVPLNKIIIKLAERLERGKREEKGEEGQTLLGGSSWATSGLLRGQP